MARAHLFEFEDFEQTPKFVRDSLTDMLHLLHKTIDTANIKDPVVGFIFGAKGLMYNLTLEGSKIHKLDKS